MRLDINLASQPYEDARQFWTVWGTAVGLAGVLTLVLLVLDVTGWVRASSDRHMMEQKRVLIAERDQLRANAQEFLNRPENRVTRDKSQLLNELIERKAFSWTRVLESLEKVMPPRVHLVAISPALTEDNELALKMTVAGDSRDRAIELARRMEASQQFAQTSILRESSVDSRTGDTEQVEMAAIYVPEAQVPGAKAPETPADSKTKAATGNDGKETENKPKSQAAGTNGGAVQAVPRATPQAGSRH
jgi:Tfp pilus assembly protein PilN